MEARIHLCHISHIDDWRSSLLLDTLYQAVDNLHNVMVVLPASSQTFTTQEVWHATYWGVDLSCQAARG